MGLLHARTLASLLLMILPYKTDRLTLQSDRTCRRADCMPEVMLLCTASRRSSTSRQNKLRGKVHTWLPSAMDVPWSQATHTAVMIVWLPMAR